MSSKYPYQTKIGSNFLRPQQVRGISRSITIHTECLSERQLNGWTISSLIGSGFFGDVFKLCNRDGCHHRVVKIIPFVSPDAAAEFTQEVHTLTLAAANDVGPQIYDSWTCNNISVEFSPEFADKYTSGKKLLSTTVGFIVTEKWDNNLENVQDLVKPETKELFDDLAYRLWLFNMKEKIYNPDIRGENIFVKYTPNGQSIAKLTIGDWGWVDLNMETPLDLFRKLLSQIYRLYLPRK
jgi:hypothetical protein